MVTPMEQPARRIRGAVVVGEVLKKNPAFSGPACRLVESASWPGDHRKAPIAVIETAR